ncbi:YciI family protein [Pseudonocardia thermophila]|uniref:YciI family protein n=1 Tax=Pseudonocardia thermophila TaxID=1848 RepID=UPI0009379EBE|nr:YciI family protein [Pseudonocardia thermophila]
MTRGGTVQYLLSIYQPEETPSEEELAPVMAELDRLTADLKAAGKWVFSVGLHGPSTATVVRTRDGEVLVTDGPFAEAKEHLGGFLVISAEDLDEALAWIRRLTAIITPLAVEVRPIVTTG